MEDVPRRAFHASQPRPEIMRNDEVSPRKPNVYRALARNLSPCARDRHRSAGPGATSEGGASASLPDEHLQDSSVPAHELRVSSAGAGEARMRGDDTAEAGQVRLGVVPVDDGVWIPSVCQHDVDGDALHGLGRRAFDADDPHVHVDHSAIAKPGAASHSARPTSSVRFYDDVPLPEVSRGRDEESDAPEAIAAHLRDISTSTPPSSGTAMTTKSFPSPSTLSNSARLTRA